MTQCMTSMTWLTDLLAWHTWCCRQRRGGLTDTNIDCWRTAHRLHSGSTGDNLTRRCSLPTPSPHYTFSIDWAFYPLCNAKWLSARTEQQAGDWRISTHADPIRPHDAFHKRRICSVTFTWAHLYGNVYMRVGVALALADSSDFGLLGSKVHKNLWCPANWTPMNRRACDATSVILGGEIRNRTNTNKNSKRYIHTLPIGTCE